jgi:hypothetical protein
MPEKLKTETVIIPANRHQGGQTVDTKRHLYKLAPGNPQPPTMSVRKRIAVEVISDTI